MKRKKTRSVAKLSANGAITMAMIATKAKCSKATVSLALREDERIPPDTRSRVHSVAKALGYVKNPVMAELLSEIQRCRPVRYKRTLALLNAHEDRLAFERHATIPAWVKGCRLRGEAQGYRFDEFWLRDPDLTAERLEGIFQARGIRGVIVFGLFKQNWLPREYDPIWRRYPAIVAGVRTHAPTLSFCSVDHHECVLEAVARVRALGYRRPGLFLDGAIDRLVDGRFTAGFMTGVADLPQSDRVRPLDASVKHERFLETLESWMRRETPDVVLTIHNETFGWLENLGYRVPRDLGLVHLERNRTVMHWAGMEQHNDIAGECALDMLITMLLNRESGVPVYARAMQVSATWTDGTTVRVQTVNRTG
ncbi:LacI family DNA-binding transcriptional regulator [Oleiharenicola lentus]|nr:LacI family DNA-binding transcriptional regulator [Oleiharenicola lentus]